MKTAISLPDEVFRAGEVLAKRLHVSRSALYARAVREYVRRHRDGLVTAKLNEVYGAEDSSLDPGFLLAEAKVMHRKP